MQILRQATTLQERAALQGEIVRAVERRMKMLESGAVEPRKLALKRALTWEVEDYKAEARTAQAAKQMQDAGIKVHAGESVKYVLSGKQAKGKKQQVRAYPLKTKTRYDAQAYVEMLRDAVNEVYP